MFENQEFQIEVCCDTMADFLMNEETRMDWSEDGMPYLWMADCDLFPLRFCPFCGKVVGFTKRVKE